MAVDPVPGFIGGSQVDAYVLREFVNMATRDSEGVQLPTAGKVTATSVPSGSVDIAAGGLVVRNRQAPGQSYVGRIASSTNQAVTPAGGAGKSVLITMTVRDPDFSPWQAYTDPNQILFGPYFYPEVLACSNSTVSASQVVTYSTYAVARIDMPPNTTNITNAMITDLRQLAQPRNGFARAVQQGPGTTDNLTLAQTSWRTWPTNSLGVTVPTWATHMVGSIRLLQVQSDGASDFQARINIGGLTGNGTNFDYNGNAGTSVGFVEGIAFEIFADINVTSLQGQTVVVQPQAQRTFTANTGNIWFNARQQVVFDLMFAERTL